MKKLAFFLYIFGLVLYAGSPIIWAEMIDQNLKPLSEVLQQLHKRGIVDIDHIELNKGVYKAVLIGTYGRRQIIYIDAKSEAIKAKYNENEERLTMLVIAKKVESAGYSHIYMIEARGNEYEVKAFNNDGKKIGLLLDSINGEIKKDWVE